MEKQKEDEDGYIELGFFRKLKEESPRRMLEDELA